MSLLLLTTNMADTRESGNEKTDSSRKLSIVIESVSGQHEREETDLDEALISRENTQASDISIVQPKFDVRSKSSLKSVLEEYGLPDEEVKRLEEQQQKEDKKKKKKRKSSTPGTGNNEGKAESYINVYKDHYQTKEVVVEDIMEKLTDKVDQQRKMIKRKSEQLEKKQKEREENVKQQRRSLRKASRVDLHHDDAFMKQLPKSQFYKLVAIEDRLKARGYLKGQLELDDFWQSVKKPEVFERYMKCVVSGQDLAEVSESKESPESKELSSASSSSLNSLNQSQRVADKENMEFRPLTQISEGQENSRPTTKERQSPHSSRKVHRKSLTAPPNSPTHKTTGQKTSPKMKGHAQSKQNVPSPTNSNIAKSRRNSLQSQSPRNSLQPKSPRNSLQPKSLRNSLQPQSSESEEIPEPPKITAKISFKPLSHRTSLRPQSSPKAHRSRSINASLKAKSPIASPKSKSPIASPKAKSPISSPKAKSPIASPKAKSPIASPTAKSPITSPKAQSPYASPKPKSPNVSPKAQSPIDTPKPLSRIVSGEILGNILAEVLRPHSAPKESKWTKLQKKQAFRRIHDRIQSANGSLQSPVKRKDPHAIARAAAVELERKYPMVELPPLACYTMKLGEEPPDPEQILKDMDKHKREKERLLFIKRIRKMYNLAQSNVATTKRILQKHEGEFDQWYGGSSPINSMMSPVEDNKPVYCTDVATYQTLEERQEEELLQRQPWLKFVKNRDLSPIEVKTVENTAKSKSTRKKSAKDRNSQAQSTANSRNSRPTSSKLEQQQRPDPPPSLCMESLTGYSKVVEAKCLSTLWRPELR